MKILENMIGVTLMKQVAHTVDITGHGINHRVKHEEVVVKDNQEELDGVENKLGEIQ